MKYVLFIIKTQYKYRSFRVPLTNHGNCVVKNGKSAPFELTYF